MATDPALDAFVRGAADDFAAQCAPTVLVDINVPTWRYQLRGREGLRAVLAEQEFVPGRTVAATRSVTTADGLLFEIESHAPVNGSPGRWRQLVWLRGTPGAWQEVVVYCTGIWDPATVERHASQAPMVTS